MTTRKQQPVTVAAGNCMSVSASKATSTSIFCAYLDLGADVLLLTECADFDGQQVADRHHPGVYKVVQFGGLGSAESGTLVAYRCDLGAHLETRIRVGSEATSEGGGIRMRPIVSVRLRLPGRRWPRWFTAGHAPPPRAPRARAAFMRVFARVRGTKGGDLNLAGRIVARILVGQRVQGFGVLHVAVPRGIPVSKARMIPKAELGSADHDGVWLTLWPRKRRR